MNKKLLALLTCILLASGCATKSEMNDMSQRVGLLEVKTNQALEKIRREQAEIKADLLDIRANTQTISGQLSSRTHEEEQKTSMESSMVMQLQHMQQQVHALEQMLGVSPPPADASTTPPGIPGPPGIPAPPSTETQQMEQEAAQPPNMKQSYEAAFSLYKEGNLEAARGAFEQFLAAYPRTELSDNALFWIGETYYRTGNFKDAIVKYHEIIEKYPKGTKVPDALLKLGLAFSMIGEDEAAISSLKKLIEKYPDAPHVKAAQKKLESLQASAKPSSAGKKPKATRKKSP